MCCSDNKETSVSVSPLKERLEQLISAINASHRQYTFDYRGILECLKDEAIKVLKTIENQSASEQYRLATEKDIGKMVYVTDDENDLNFGRSSLSKLIHVSSKLESGKYICEEDDGDILQWRYAYVKIPQYRAPSKADIGNLIEATDFGFNQDGAHYAVGRLAFINEDIHFPYTLSNSFGTASYRYARVKL